MKRSTISLYFFMAIIGIMFSLSVAVVSSDPDHMGHLWVDTIGPINTVDVLPGSPHELVVHDLDASWTSCQVKVSNENTWRTVTVSGGVTALFNWQCPVDAKFDDEYVVQVKHDSSPTYVVYGIIQMNAKLHVIPDVPLGTGMSVTVLLGSLAVFWVFRRRNRQDSCK